jgi:drug/metabolite transporter (DMT)-like permease
LNRSILLGSLLVVGAASLFGTLGYLSREASAVGMDAAAFVAWRAAIATLALIAASLLLSARGVAPLPDPRLLSQRQLTALLVACAIGAVLNIALFAAFLRTTIAVVLICFYTFPAMVTLAAVRLYGERIDRLRLGALTLSSVGLALVVLAPVLEQDELTIDLVGVGLALFAAVCQAAFLLLTARGFRPFAALHVATYVVAVAVVIAVALLVVVGDLSGLRVPFSDTRAWAWIIAAGLTGAAIPITALLAGMGLIGPTRTAILMTFEPVVGVLLAGALLNEQPAALQLLGGAGVLVAAVILQVAPRAPLPAEPEFIHPG